MHLWLHLLRGIPSFGNPRLSRGTWIDEGLNHNLAKLVGAAHSAVWHRRVLTTMAEFNTQTTNAK